MTDPKLSSLRVELCSIDEILANDRAQLVLLRKEIAELKERRADVLRQVRARREQLKAEADLARDSLMANMCEGLPGDSAIASAIASSSPNSSTCHRESTP